MSKKITLNGIIKILFLISIVLILSGGIFLKDVYAAKTSKKKDTKKETYSVVYNLPQTSDEDRITVSVRNSSGKTYYYRIFNQAAQNYESHNVFLKQHGCSITAFTTLLTSRVPQFVNYKPNDVIAKIEPKVFSKSAYKKNYSKKMKAQRPLSFYGMTRIMKKYNIKYKHVYKYKKNNAKKEITAHLKTGNPVLINVKKGKWANSYHTMLLLGITERGKIIIADSADREWSGKNQRIKYGTLDELMKDMWSGVRSTSVYWNGRKNCGGYILIY